MNARLSAPQLSGPIETTQCDYETVESATEVLFDRLGQLVKMPFFKYYKVDLFRECPFWAEDGLCMQRTCAVESMDESDVPEHWRAEALSRIKTSSDPNAHRYPGCYYSDSDFCFLDDDTSEDSQYIDLTLNPESFTGYAGDSAHRVWSAIYKENCFGLTERTLPDAEQAPTIGGSIAPIALEGKDKLEEEGECTEKRVYYRIISGMHASISTHLCYEYLDQSTGEWGPNLLCFVRRVASHPERLQQIYFNTVLLLRALTRLEPYLAAYDIRTGDSKADSETKQMLTSVMDIAKRVGRFDERGLFKGENAELMKEQFKATFRNVSLIMDCVGCDKCRLWGKIQTSGVGTALKILFELDDRALNPKRNPNLLQRSEIVALVNSLHRFTESLHMTGKFREMWAESEGKGPGMKSWG
ncbi:endoplasmic reticulum oxidoreductin 1 [Calocera cornea HHB12733]|uniref:Endoplasmic reticulum oxidoreductin 1 n=1 Tax=Calocera cornea HHB12733 TaxID=1353952 RepID=A0A165JLE8_9BASI|nr:endoplasmic reticulum oxidoreductin 1 [Calocera cornea HHB12733]